MKKRKRNLDQGCRKKVGVHQESVLSLLLFAIVVDEITENARKSWMNEILYADENGGNYGKVENFWRMEKIV